MLGSTSCATSSLRLSSIVDAWTVVRCLVPSLAEGPIARVVALPVRSTVEPTRLRRCLPAAAAEAGQASLGDHINYCRETREMNPRGSLNICKLTVNKVPLCQRNHPTYIDSGLLL